MTALEQFRFSAFMDWNIDTLSMINSSEVLANALNTQLSLHKYGEALESISFFYIYMENTNLHPNEKFYSKKKKNIIINLQLDFKKAYRVSFEELTELKAILYLESIKRYKAWRIKDFDNESFYQDVRSIFLERGIIQLDNLLKSHEWIRIPI
jgi:hypothetical protein